MAPSLSRYLEQQIDLSAERSNHVLRVLSIPSASLSEDGLQVRNVRCDPDINAGALPNVFEAGTASYLRVMGRLSVDQELTTRIQHELAMYQAGMTSDGDSIQAHCATVGWTVPGNPHARWKMVANSNTDGLRAANQHEVSANPSM